jgi:Protein of unknown function (DUF3800)
VHIFIDESGIFVPQKESSKWSSVGALVVPDKSLSALETALKKLKQAHGVNSADEFDKNNRPDCSSDAFSEFLKEIDSLDCVLQITATNGSFSEAEGLAQHRESTKEAIAAYARKNPDAAASVENISRSIDQLSAQQYNQCILQINLIFDVLPKIITHYSSDHPEELGCFTWVVDRKDIKETKYECVFKALYSGMISSYFTSRIPPIVHDGGRDYGHFVMAYSSPVRIQEALKTTKDIYEVDISDLSEDLMAVDLGDLLRRDFRLLGSKESFGLQSIDLLVSGINRCLKRNYTDNEKMATALGRLMINSPLTYGRALTIMGHRPTAIMEDGDAVSLIELMDGASKKLFSEVFRENYSRRLNHYSQSPSLSKSF